MRNLEQANLNQFVIARDAMRDGGRITVEIENAYVDGAYTRRAEIGTGEYVMIAVSYAGTGNRQSAIGNRQSAIGNRQSAIGNDTETLDRFFESCFKTKEVGRGTGLGLSQVYGSVKQSQGHIKLYSELGQGTSVKSYLPRCVGA